MAERIGKKGLVKWGNSELKKTELNIQLIDLVIPNSKIELAKIGEYKNIIKRFNEIDSHFLIRMLSKYHNFSDSFLNAVDKILSIEALHVSWSQGLSELRIISNLFSNPNFAWTEERLIKYEASLNWGVLSSNQQITWTEKNLLNYRDQLIWGEFKGRFGLFSEKGLSSNIRFNYDLDFLNKYKSEIDWKILSNNVSVPWSIEILREFEDYIDWKELSSNKGVPWTKELIVTFLNKWYRTYLFTQSEIPWDEELIENFAPTTKEWRLLSVDSNIPKSSELFQKYKERWDWHLLSSNPNVIWTEAFIKKNSSVFNWGQKSHLATHIYGGLSANPSLPWSTDLIDRFFNQWEWSSLSGNEGLEWNMDMIRRYKDYLDWEVLSKNTSIPWSIELIQEFVDKWDWNELIKNPFLPWSDEFLSYLYEREEIKSFYYLSCNRGLYNHINSVFTENQLEAFMISIIK